MCHTPDSRPPDPPVTGRLGGTRTLQLTADDGAAVGAFEAYPSEESSSRIVILPDVRGLHPFYQALAERFADAGLHAIAIDSRGRVFVGDRGNNRVQLFDQEGKSLAVWTQFGKPSGARVGHADGVLDARGGRELRFEGFHLGAEDVPAAREDALDRLADLRGVGTGTQIGEGQPFAVGMVHDAPTRAVAATYCDMCAR